MEISLRIANQYVNEITTFLKSNNFNSNGTIRWETYKGLVKQEDIDIFSTKWTDKVNTHTTLIKILYFLRGEIGKANADSGISDWLTGKVELSAVNKILEQAIAVYEKNIEYNNQSILDLNKKIQEVSNSESNWHSEKSVDINVISKEFYDKAKVTLLENKREIAEMKDSIISANSKETVNIGDEDILILNSIGIV